MTNKEAIEILKEANGIVYSEYCGIDDDKLVDEVNEAVNIAIESLEQKPNHINIPQNATNGDVLKMLFPPSVYYGDDEKHWMILAKDVTFNCLNEDWWNAPYR